MIVSELPHLPQEGINELLVRDGWALAYRQYSKDYVRAEGQAKRTNVVLWQGYGSGYPIEVLMEWVKKW